jgi:tryptophanyl-tRNA synthetase
MTAQDELAAAAAAASESIAKIQSEYGYKDIASTDSLGPLDGDYLKTKFSCHDNLEALKGKDPSKVAIVTGFGPTNSPTAGTLSVILKTIALQKETGIDTEIIISNLGAYLSRNMSFDQLQTNTNRFLEFIKLMGFDYSKGRVRTHIDKENLGISTFLNEHILTTKDFSDNKEATEELYGKMGLLGNKMGIITDATYTVADILKPLFGKETVTAVPHGKENVLVIAGIEEHYFPRLAKLAIDRMKTKFPDEYISKDADVSALYTTLIRGLAPYPKMSKSQPDSAINIGEKPEVIRKKIMHCKPENEVVIMQMMAQASMWSQDKIKGALAAFEHREQEPQAWKKLKEEYTQHFIDIAKKWELAAKKYPDPPETAKCWVRR